MNLNPYESKGAIELPKPRDSKLRKIRNVSGIIFVASILVANALVFSNKDGLKTFMEADASAIALEAFYSLKSTLNILLFLVALTAISGLVALYTTIRIGFRKK